MLIKCLSGVQPDNLILACAVFNAYTEWHSVDNIHSAMGDAPDVLMITAGSNGKHKAGSRHGTYQALDVRSKTFTDKLQFVGAVVNRLGPAVAVTTDDGPGFQTKDGKWLGILEDEGGPNEHFHFERN